MKSFIGYLSDACDLLSSDTTAAFHNEEKLQVPDIATVERACCSFKKTMLYNFV